MSRNDRLSLGPHLSGLWLRLIAVVIALSAGVALELPWAWIGVLLVVSLAGGMFPQTAGMWLAAIVLIGALIAQPPAIAPTAITVAAVHALHVLGSLTHVVTLSARVSLRALVPSLMRFVVVQLVTQSLVVALTLLATDARAPAAVIVGAVAGLTVIASGVWLWHRQRLLAFSNVDSRAQR